MKWMERILATLIFLQLSRICWSKLQNLKLTSSELSIESLITQVLSKQRCVNCLTDQSPFAIRVADSLTGQSPTVLEPELPLDLYHCPALVLAGNSATALLSSINGTSGFSSTLNPTHLVLLLTTGPLTDFNQAQEKLNIFRRTRFLWISINKKTMEYYTFANMTSLILISEERILAVAKQVERPNDISRYKGEPFKIVAINYTLYSQMSTPDKNGRVSWFSGFELSLLVMLCQEVGLSPEVYALGDSEHPFDSFTLEGRLKVAGIQTVARTWSADGVVGEIWLRPGYDKYYNFLSPWGLGCYRYLVPRPRRVKHDWNIYLDPFDSGTWTLIAFGIVSVALTCKIFSKLSPNPRVNEGSLWTWLFTCCCMLVQSDYPRRATGVQVPLTGGWLWVSFILGSVFSGTLSSVFIATELEPKVDTIPAFLKNGFTWGKVILNREDPTASSIFAEESSSEWREWTFKRFREETGPRDLTERMLSRRYAVPGTSHGKIFFYQNPPPFPPYQVYRHYEVASDCYQNFLSSSLFPKGSPYWRSLEKTLSRYREGGILNSWDERQIMSSPFLRQFVPWNVFMLTKWRASSDVSPLGFRETSMAFLLLAGGCLLAGVVHWTEHWLARRSRGPARGLDRPARRNIPRRRDSAFFQPWIWNPELDRSFFRR